MVTAIFDISIALTSLAACFYCYVLGRRLTALQNTKDGIGAAVLALSKSTNAMNTSTKQTGEQAQFMARQLSKLLADAEAQCLKVEDLTLTMEGRHKAALLGIHDAQADLEQRIGKILDDYKIKISELSALADQIKLLVEDNSTGNDLSRATASQDSNNIHHLTNLQELAGSK